MTKATGEAPVRRAPDAPPRSNTSRVNPRHNADVAWDTFAPQAYWEHNYQKLRKDDHAIIERVGAFFMRHFGSAQHLGLKGLDVGSGSNLYPAMGMLPWCATVTLTDHSQANVRWLKGNVGARRSVLGDGLRWRFKRRRRAPEPETPWPWQQFWNAYVDQGGYPTDLDARRLLAERAIVKQCSVFDLKPNTYDIGTMFFVAESMTSYQEEFEDATKSFLNALRPGSPFAAAFMDSSEGYTVAGQSFPAVREVTFDRVQNVLDELKTDVTVDKIGNDVDKPLRKGYDGMIIAVGTTAIR